MACHKDLGVLFGDVCMQRHAYVRHAYVRHVTFRKDYVRHVHVKVRSVNFRYVT